MGPKERELAAVGVLAAAAVAAVLLTRQPSTPPPTVGLPVRVALVVPKGYPAYMDWDAAAAVVRDHWIPDIQHWYATQAGLTFNAEFRLLRSQYTIYELAQNPPGEPPGTQLDGCPYAPIPEGQSIHATQVGNRVIAGELGWGQTSNSRTWIVAIGAGGWAGGFPPDPQNRAWCMVGDWGLRFAVTGKPDPCAVLKMGASAAMDPNTAGALGHEGLHTMWGVDPHHPYVSTGDPLSQTQVAALHDPHNLLFLSPAAVPV